jgi:L-aspartate oxidase
LARRQHDDLNQFDVVILGSGAAGLTTALALADRFRIAVLSKGALSAGSTAWAQGGIAAVLEDGDTFESHVEDTMIAGAGLCHRAAVEFVVERAPAAIEQLVKLGVAFNKGEDEAHPFHLTREGGHSHRRIVHVDDATGWAVQSVLEQRTRDHPNITVFEQRTAIDLITERHTDSTERRCHGVYVFNEKTRRVERFQSKALVIASGGVANMEFNQFHPTCLYNSKVKNFLVTEAIRGEGGVLKLPDGSRFMDTYDERAELAPRDIVARAIDSEMKRLGARHLYLDISHKDPDFVRGHFPTIYERLLELGIDMTRQPIPIVPAAHYTCGGVMTDLHGRTDIPHLYAVGEATHTGLHGANRMASNSLLECLVFGQAAAADIRARFDEWSEPSIANPWDESRVTDSDEEVVVSHNWSEVRQFMWDYVGIVRTTKRLERAKHRVDLLRGEIDDYYGNFRVNRNVIELRNLVTVANLIVRSALERKESRGLHYTRDYPKQLPQARDTILLR